MVAKLGTQAIRPGLDPDQPIEQAASTSSMYRFN
jgi:hypothetical protein